MHYIEAKTILSPKNGMNVYRGCTHGCIYCDSRSSCYQMDHPFEDVAVKENALSLLEAALRRKKRPCMIGFGSMSDPYMHCEQELGYTRRCLELVEAYGFGVTLITKSDLVLRDMDLLARINEKTKAVVQVTLTTYDEKLCGILEPNVCTTKRRYEVLKACQERGIPTVVWLCPILPYINDTEANLRGILDYCLDAGVQGIVNFGFGVTLREGNREYFYAQLERHFPGMKEQYIRRFGEAYSCPSPKHDRLARIFAETKGFMHKPEEIFAYLNAFPEGYEQLRLI